MAEWHTTPDYIVSNWTDELFSLMLEKFIERRKREDEALQASSRGSQAVHVSDSELFARAGIKVEKLDGD